MRTVHALLHDILHSSCDLLQRIVILGAKNYTNSNSALVSTSPSRKMHLVVDARDTCAWNGCTHCVLLTKWMGRQAELHRGHRASARGPSAATRRRFGAALLLFLGRQARPPLPSPNLKSTDWRLYCISTLEPARRERFTFMPHPRGRGV